MTNTDRDLLFGVIALQNGLIETRQFVDAFTLWAAHKTNSLATLLVEHGWLDPTDRHHIEYLVERHIKKHWRPAESLAAPTDPSKHTAPNLAKAQTYQLRKGAATDDPPVRVSPISPPLRDDGRLTLLGVLSTGGIGQVWKALDQVFDRIVALKELKPDLATNPQHQERFVREARITGQLEHPGIVPVYDFHAGDDATRCYYTMRFVKGRTLTEVIREYHRERLAGSSGRFLPLLQNFISVCQTIAYAHSRNVIHRDLKGDNIIVGDFGEVIVLDWGLAKRLDDNPVETAEPSHGETMAHLELKPASVTSHDATEQGERLGTPAYMAPEQATGQIHLLDARTDVYGLAAILYEILVGDPPFWGTSILDTVRKVINEPPISPRERVAEVPVELENLCLRGLAKDRNDRPGSAAELALRVQFWIAERAERKRTEQERERFFNLSLDMLAILDLEGRLTQTNPAWGAILGWSAEQVHGHDVCDFIHSDDRHRMKMTLERLLASESATDVELRCVTRGGSARWVHWNVTLIRGEATLYVVGRDVSERKQAEQMFRELLESAPDAMVVVNSAGCVVLVNTQMERLFGYTREEVVGQSIEVYVPLAYRADHVGKVNAYSAKPSFRPMGAGRELLGQHKEGHVFPVEISLSPVRTEQGLFISCAIRGKVRMPE